MVETARQAEVRLQITEALRGIVAQRLVPTVDGRRVAAFEVLINSPRRSREHRVWQHRGDPDRAGVPAGWDTDARTIACRGGGTGTGHIRNRSRAGERLQGARSASLRRDRHMLPLTLGWTNPVGWQQSSDDSGFHHMLLHKAGSIDYPLLIGTVG